MLWCQIDAPHLELDVLVKHKGSHAACFPLIPQASSLISCVGGDTGREPGQAYCMHGAQMVFGEGFSAKLYKHY